MGSSFFSKIILREELRIHIRVRDNDAIINRAIAKKKRMTVLNPKREIFDKNYLLVIKQKEISFLRTLRGPPDQKQKI